MDGNRTIDIPIITLPEVVFFPQTSLPLHILDPYYIRMVKDAVATQTPVGIALQKIQFCDDQLKVLTPAPCKIFSVGLATIIDDTSNGLLILLQGLERAVVEDQIQELPYPLYRCRYLPRLVTEGGQHFENKIEQLRQLLDSWIDVNLENARERELMRERINQPQQIVDYIAMFMLPTPQLKQQLLECHLMTEQIQMLHLLFRKMDHSIDLEALEALTEFDQMEQDMVEVQ
jgi:Lon protease-like protein